MSYESHLTIWQNMYSNYNFTRVFISFFSTFPCINFIFIQWKLLKNVTPIIITLLFIIFFWGGGDFNLYRWYLTFVTIVIRILSTNALALLPIFYHHKLFDTCNGLKTIRYGYLHHAHKLKTEQMIDHNYTFWYTLTRMNNHRQKGWKNVKIGHYKAWTDIL